MVNNKHLLDILTPELAYWIGYIAADGSIKKDGYKLNFCIKDTDRVLLDELVKYFDITNPISYREIFDKRTNKMYNQVLLQICDSTFVKKLAQYNLTATKSKDFFIPDCILQELYFYDFLRGLLDGDGCISKSTGNPRLSFLTTLKAAKQIQLFLSNDIGYKKGALHSKSKDVNFEAYNLVIYQQAVEVLHKIYKNGYILKRKYDKYQESILLENQKSIGKGGTRLTRVVELYTKDMLLVKHFSSIKELALYLSIPQSTISNIIAGKNPQPANFIIQAKGYLKNKEQRNGVIIQINYNKK